MSEWETVLLADVASEITVGFVGTMVNEYVDNGIPFLRSLNIEPYRVNVQDLKYISPNFHHRIAKSKLSPGDLAIVRTGKPGTATVIPESLGECNCSDLVIIRPSKKLDTNFLAYLFNSQWGQNAVIGRLVGSVQKHFNIGDAKRLKVNLPPLEEQREIAHILGGLDDKIEANRRMNATLEATARALFQSWFVDFDPVRAKTEGRQPEGMDAETAALFPDSFEDSELGLIPKGWRVSDIYEVANVVYGAPFASTQFNSEGYGLPLIRIRDLKTNQPDIFTDENHPKAQIIDLGDILIGMDGEFRVYRWQGRQGYLNQRVCTFIPKNGFLKTFIAESVITPLAFFERSKIGTTVIHLGKSDIDTFRIVLPPMSILIKFGGMVEPLWEKILAGAIESRTLAETRDALLPKLVSGQVRVGTIRN